MHGAFFSVRPARGNSYGCKPHRKLTTTNEAKRNCVRVTERRDDSRLVCLFEEQWSCRWRNSQDMGARLRLPTVQAYRYLRGVSVGPAYRANIRRHYGRGYPDEILECCGPCHGDGIHESSAPVLCWGRHVEGRTSLSIMRCLFWSQRMHSRH
jgi:hypothetical protein